MNERCKRASNPVIQSVFLVVLAHSETLEDCLTPAHIPVGGGGWLSSGCGSLERLSVGIVAGGGGDGGRLMSHGGGGSRSARDGSRGLGIT